ncbi:MAG: response regulator [Candidatus Acidiferrales bacterium]|jgi:CheY-like chemotaxis protein
MSETQTLAAARVPTVYFIDDSATMREVIKIAFRKENIHVVTCADAASALAQFAETAPDAVITDVIMPDKDGYEVCQFVRQHERLGKIPVILMSGIVNQSVAEKAMTVKADELIRKPFQPQDLIARVKGLIGAKNPGLLANGSVTATPSSRPQAGALSDLFSTTPAVAPPAQAAPPQRVEPATSPVPASIEPLRPVAPAAKTLAAAPAASQPAEHHKLRNEIVRLELLVKRLQAELVAGREYCAALEAHFKRLQESD